MLGIVTFMHILVLSLPRVLQVAAQEGKFLAKLFSSHSIAPLPGAMPAADAIRPNSDKQIDTGVWVPLPDGLGPFK